MPDGHRSQPKPPPDHTHGRQTERAGVIPLLGRAGTTTNSRAPHFFSSVSSGVAGNYPAFLDGGQTLWTADLPGRGPMQLLNQNEDCDESVEPGGERLWIISTVGQEVQRFGAGALQPLRRNQIMQGNNPAGSSYTRRTQLKLGVWVHDGTANRRYFMDCGHTLEVYGRSVSLDIIGPPTMIEVLPDGPASTAAAPAGQAGVVIDSIVSAKIIGAESPLGHTTAPFTQHLSVAAGATGTIAIPPGTKSAQITQSGAGAASTIWTQHYGDPAVLATTLVMGTVLFRGGGRNTDIDLTSDATHLQTDIDPLAARFFSIVWTIQP